MSETNKILIKYNARVVMKHDTSAHWEQAENFIPLAGELIVYDDLRRIKIGDGETKVNDLPFSTIDINEYLGYETSGKTYPVELDEDNKLFVSVPWDNNTHYTTGVDISDAETKDPYLFIYDDSTERGKIKFEGGNNVSVTSRYVDGDKIISINGTKYYAKVNGGLLLDDGGYFALDSTYTATQTNFGASGRTGLMTPQDKYKLDYASMVVNHAVRANGKPMGFYKFSTTSYGFIDQIEDVSAEDIEGMEINTSTSGASANTGTIYIVGAEKQATTAKTFTNKKAYIDKSGYVYSNGSKTITEGDLFVSDTDKTIKSKYLPSYVDDVIEGFYRTVNGILDFYDSKEANANKIDRYSGKIYVDLDTNKTYRWSGTRYVEITSGPLTLGTTDTSAFQGNLGQIAYEHALHGEACDDKSTLDLYKIKTEDGHVIKAEKVTKNDILNYKAYTGSETISVTDGVISLNTAYYATAAHSGLMQAADFSHLWSIEANANNYVLPMATSSELGGIKVGANLVMSLDGTLSAAFPNANFTTDGLMTAEYYSRLMNHTHAITYTPEATVSFSGSKGNTTTGSAGQIIMAIFDPTATATVSSSYYNKNLTLTPAALSELGVSLATHIHEFTPAGTVNYQGKQAKLTTGVGTV